MFGQFITSINYEKLIQMQANQESFAPIKRNRKKSLKMENRKHQVMGAKIKTRVKKKVIRKRYPNNYLL